MRLHRHCLFVFLALLSIGAIAAESKPKTEIIAKAPSNYLALSRIHMPITMDANRQSRALDLEVWLVPKDEENLALARSAKKAIVENLKDQISGYDWEAFSDSDKGPEIIRTMVKTTVSQTCGARLSDVLIKTFVLK